MLGDRVTEKGGDNNSSVHLCYGRPDTLHECPSQTRDFLMRLRMSIRSSVGPFVRPGYFRKTNRIVFEEESYQSKTLRRG